MGPRGAGHAGSGSSDPLHSDVPRPVSDRPASQTTTLIKPIKPIKPTKPTKLTVTAATQAAQYMDRTFYKLNIQGIVYLVEPATSKAYTYDLTDPTEIGTVSWADAKQEPILTLRNDWASVLAAKVDKSAAAAATTAHATA